MSDEDVRVERVDEVLGWPLAVVGGENTPLIEEEVLGRKLGYADEEEFRSLRKLIERIWPDPNNRPRRTVIHSGGRGQPRKPYLLTRTQALKVVMRSETAVADAIQDEILRVYEAWLDGRRAVAAPLDAWAVLQASARATLELRDRVERAEGVVDEQGKRVEAVAKDAADAKRLAEQAVLLAGSKSVMDAVVEATPPGRATETPDGAFVARARDGWRSMRSVAHRFGLPCRSVGANLVGNVAHCLGLTKREGLFDEADFATAGRVKGIHLLYGPEAIKALEKPLRAAYGAMIELGYVVTEGGAMVARREGVRSKSWVVQRMFDAALETGTPKEPPTEPGPPAGDDQQDLFNKAS